MTSHRDIWFNLTSASSFPLQSVSPGSQINLLKTVLLSSCILAQKLFSSFLSLGMKGRWLSVTLGATPMTFFMQLYRLCVHRHSCPVWILYSCWLFPLHVPSTCHAHANFQSFPLNISSSGIPLNSSWPTKNFAPNKTQLKGHLPYAVSCSSSGSSWSASLGLRNLGVSVADFFVCVYAGSLYMC